MKLTKILIVVIILMNAVFILCFNTQWVRWCDIVNKPPFARVALDSSYKHLIDTPSIPTNTNQLVNDAGFITRKEAQELQTISFYNKRGIVVTDIKYFMDTFTISNQTPYVAISRYLKMLNKQRFAILNSSNLNGLSIDIEKITNDTIYFKIDKDLTNTKSVKLTFGFYAY